VQLRARENARTQGLPEMDHLLPAASLLEVLTLRTMTVKRVEAARRNFAAINGADSLSLMVTQHPQRRI
jgi:hypothetical protein